MLRERHRLRMALVRLQDAVRQGRADPAALAALATQIEASVRRRGARREALPAPAYPEELPVSEKRGEIARAIAAHQVVIVCGETGSGKTTQLPKICLELERGVAGMIAHTQPRRIAARSVAARIAEELRSPLGQHVGFRVRFSDRVSDDNFVRVMTDGILLAETQTDRFLNAYDTIIIDEAHERSLNIDFLLGYVKRLLPKRPELKLIITSATIDAQRFSEHFGNAPVIEVSGRLYPVEVRYRPIEAEDEDEKEIDLPEVIADAVDEVSRLSVTGDVLVFLPGEREIRETAEVLRKHHPQATEILPLFARLSTEEQERVFQPTGQRRIVLATNVAETSLTVPGIKYVIDPGFARVNRYSYRNKVEMLQVEKISRASADQRAGRCGRVMSGVCVRLYSEEDYQARARFTDPEILRSSLASVILRMLALKLGDVEEFPFVEAPSSRAVADGYALLQELGAVDEQRRLTPIGTQARRTAHRSQPCPHDRGGARGELLDRSADHRSRSCRCRTRATGPWRRPTRPIKPTPSSPTSAPSFSVSSSCGRSSTMRSSTRSPGASSRNCAARRSCRTCVCASGAICTVSSTPRLPRPAGAATRHPRPTTSCIARC